MEQGVEGAPGQVLHDDGEAREGLARTHQQHDVGVTEAAHQVDLRDGTPWLRLLHT